VLLSMTGFGEARYQGEDLTVAVELRAVNNRYLKVSLRAPEPFHLLEPEIERTVRAAVKRGTVQVQLQVRRLARPGDYQLNLAALRAYATQLEALQKELGAAGGWSVGQLLTLPGAVAEAEVGRDPGEDWPRIEPVLKEALAKLQGMRAEEGRAMEQEMVSLVGQIGQHLEAVRGRAPQVVEAFRDKLHERVRNLLAALDVEIDRSELLKEVAVFAERSDIAEEITRLASHLRQFQDMVREPESAGRKLEFLIQEFFREANTIGSKANDVAIARHVVEIKGAIEKMRELIQNVE
jgi:uncharacterized protein (TIGR00255 family)